MSFMKDHNHPSTVEILGLMMAALRHRLKKATGSSNRWNLNNFPLNKGIIIQGRAKQINKYNQWTRSKGNYN